MLPATVRYTVCIIIWDSYPYLSIAAGKNTAVPTEKIILSDDLSDHCDPKLCLFQGGSPPGTCELGTNSLKSKRGIKADRGCLHLQLTLHNSVFAKDTISKLI